MVMTQPMVEHVMVSKKRWLNKRTWPSKHLAIGAKHQASCLKLPSEYENCLAIMMMVKNQRSVMATPIVEYQPLMTVLATMGYQPLMLTNVVPLMMVCKPL